MPKRFIERRVNRSGRKPKQLGYTKKQLIEVSIHVNKYGCTTAEAARHIGRKLGYNARQMNNFIRAAQRHSASVLSIEQKNDT